MKTIDLRTPAYDPNEVGVGTTVISSKGFKFVKLSDDFWLDQTSGLKWYPTESEKYTYDDAMKTFNTEAKRLPTIEEFIKAEEHGFREVLGINSGYFWSSSPYPKYSDDARGFGGYNGGYTDYGGSRNFLDSVRCVGR